MYVVHVLIFLLMAKKIVIQNAVSVPRRFMTGKTEDIILYPERERERIF